MLYGHTLMGVKVLKFDGALPLRVEVGALHL